MKKIEVQKKIRVLASGLRFPEGPAFAADGSLWTVELKGGTLVRYNNGQLTRYKVGGNPNGISIDERGILWYCDAGENAVKQFDAASGAVQTIVDKVNDEPLTAPNDLALDSHGNLVFTCPGNSRNSPTGYVCVRRHDGNVKKIITGKFFPNGVAFSPDGKSLILAETYKHRLWKGDWDPEKCEWSNEHIWCGVDRPDGPGGPDGMAFHPNGKLYLAVYGTAKVVEVDASGTVSGEILLQGQCPTNCAFDTIGKLGLVVTEADRGELLAIPLEDM